MLGKSLEGGKHGREAVGMFVLTCESVSLKRGNMTCIGFGLLFRGGGWGCLISNLDRRLHIPRGVPGVDR